MKLISMMLFAISFSAVAACPEFNPPAKFKAWEELITIGTDMILMEDKVRIGEVEERTMRFTPTFDLYNVEGKKVASARKKFFSWGTTIEVTDCMGAPIGTVKENIFKSLFDFYTSYDILDPKGNLIASTSKTEFFATKFTILDRNKQEVMNITRPSFNFLVDKWTVQILKKNVVDPRIMTMIPAFKTSADNKKREEEKKEKK